MAGFAVGWRVIIGEIGNILEFLHFKFYFDFKLLSVLQLPAAWFVFWNILFFNIIFDCV